MPPFALFLIALGLTDGADLLACNRMTLDPNPSPRLARSDDDDVLLQRDRYR